MRWTPGQRSGNIEDRRGEGGGGGISFGGAGGKLGCGGFLLLAVLSIVFKQDFFQLLDQSGAGGGGYTTSAPGESGGAVQESAQEKNLADFVDFVQGDVQNTWKKLFQQGGENYRETKIVLFRDATRTACGYGETASGPFYCPGDQKVYIDLAFYDELDRRFGAPGDFAQAYVLAHEIGHHVQNLLGIERQVRQAQQQRPGAANQFSVALELQADCFAGIWAHSTQQRDILDPGDIDEGLNAASSVGDDKLQKAATGYVNPDSFTHGSAKQRAEWFRRGYQSGNIDNCDTFGKGN